MLRPSIEEVNGVVGKKCTNCMTWKPFEQYFKEKNGLGGFRAKCKECVKQQYELKKDEIKKYKQEYYLENKSQVLQKSKEYREKNQKSIKKTRQRYYEQNRKQIIDSARKYRIKNLDKVAQRAKLYRIENADKTRLYTAKRKAIKKCLPNDLTSEQMDKISNYFNGCALTDESDYHWDHVIPLSIGHGGTTYGNMIPLRTDLNESKQNQNLFDWFEANRQRFNLSTEKFETLIDYLSEINNVTKEEYKCHVYWCHENPHHFDENGEAL